MDGSDHPRRKKRDASKPPSNASMMEAQAAPPPSGTIAPSSGLAEASRSEVPAALGKLTTTSMTAAALVIDNVSAESHLVGAVVSFCLCNQLFNAVT